MRYLHSNEFTGGPAVGELKFSMVQKKLQKVLVEESASWGKCQLGEVPVEGRASWGKRQLGEVPN